MGQRPMRIAEFAEYLRVLAALLRGETIDYAFNGVAKPIRMLMHDDRVSLVEALDESALGLRPRPTGYFAARAIAS